MTTSELGRRREKKRGEKGTEFRTRKVVFTFSRWAELMEVKIPLQFPFHGVARNVKKKGKMLKIFYFKRMRERVIDPALNLNIFYSIYQSTS